MPRFHFDIHENGNLILDESDQDFVNVEERGRRLC